MQTIIQRGFVLSPVTRPFRRMFAHASCAPLPSVAQGPAALKGCYDVLHRNKQFRFVPEPTTTHGHATLVDDGSCWVCFSGGKDSVCAAIRAEKKGLSPRLLHVGGLRKALSNEWNESAEVARLLLRGRGAPEPEFVAFGVAGRSNYSDNPTANQFFVACAVDMAIRKGGSRFTLGVSPYETLEDVQDCGLCDCKEMIAAQNVYFETVTDGYVWEQLTDVQTDSLLCVASNRPDLLDILTGCLTSVRFKAFRRNHNMKKFGVVLPPNRCGSCEKCAVEHLVLCGIGARESTDAFDHHCRKVLLRETNRARHDAGLEPERDLEKAADHFLDWSLVEDYNREPGLWP